VLQLGVGPACLHPYISMMSLMLMSLMVSAAGKAAVGTLLRALSELSLKQCTATVAICRHCSFCYALFLGVSLCCLLQAVFLLIGKTSALTMNIAGVIKDWMLIFFSYYLFRAPVTRLNLIGYIFCCRY
jgi:hypothetical protein